LCLQQQLLLSADVGGLHVEGVAGAAARPQQQALQLLALLVTPDWDCLAAQAAAAGFVAPAALVVTRYAAAAGAAAAAVLLCQSALAAPEVLLQKLLHPEPSFRTPLICQKVSATLA
jgi:hypothetical protein